MEIINNKTEDIFNSSRMFLLLLFIEFINVIYSYIIDSFLLSKIVLLTILLLLFSFSFFEEKLKNHFSFEKITLIVYFIYFFFFVPKNNELFSYGFYLIEISLVLVFSSFKLINKIFINFIFVILIIILELLFFKIDLSSIREFFFLISFSLFTLIAIFLSNTITSKLLYLLYDSELKAKEIENANKFFKTILNQEKIQILYFYPEDNKAIILRGTLSEEKQEEISDFFDYVRVNNLVSIEYFGIIQNAISIAKKDGYCSIILPIKLFTKDTAWMRLNGSNVFDEKQGKERIIVSITNINDVKNVELKFKNALEQCSISTWEYDIIHDKIFNYSDLLLEYYFYGNVIENASKTIVSRKIIYYEDIDIFNEGMAKVKNGESEVTFEIRAFPSRNSYYTWVRFHFTCFKNNEGLPSHAWCSIENIDDAKASEKWFELERKKNLDSQSGLIIMIEMNVSRNFVINYDSSYIKSIKKPKDNSIASLLQAFIDTGIIVKDVDLLFKRLSQEYLLECYENGQRVLEFKYKVINKSNDVQYLSNIVKLFYDTKTKEIISFIFVYDITESTILNMSLDAIFSRNFVYLAYVNLLNTHMSISKTQLIDVTNKLNPHRIYKFEWEVFIQKYVHPDDREFVHSQVDIENVRTQMRYKNIFSFDYRISDNGNMITMRRCYFIKAKENEPIILIIEQNISSEMIYRTKHEVVLKSALEKATQAANAKSEFLSRMSHEIRTPLSAIIGLSELGKEKENINSVDYFDKIYDSSKYLLGLLNDILDMNKIELNQVKLNFEPVDIEEFYNVILMIIENQALKKQIKFEFKKEGPFYKYQIIERLRVQQILLNILNNALKYTHNKGLVIYTIENIEEGDKLYAIHKVKDNGVGISKTFLKDIYSPFAREKNSLSDTEGGTGLGLAICSNLVKQLNGEIKVESELDIGTTVTIKIPIQVITKEEYLKKVNNINVEINNKNYSNKKILIAEDHDINAMVIKSILDDLGIESERVSNGLSAIKKINDSKIDEFDLILMDIMMPDLDGLNAAKRIRALDRSDVKNIPIIALSANAFDEDIERSLEYGMNEHLKKPIERKLLILTLNKYL